MTTAVRDTSALHDSLDRSGVAAAIKAQVAEGVDELTVDLRNALSLDASTLLLCAAVIATRARCGLGVVLRLPAEPAGRDFLRAWAFQAAVETAADVSLRRLVYPADRKHFGADPEPAPEPKIRVGVEGIVQRLEQERFFAAATYHLGANANVTDMIHREWSRWRKHLFVDGLGPHLRGPRQDVARVVIQELLANAAQHPDARIATVTATVSADTAGDRYLVIAMWDDGTSIIKTLRSCLDDGQPIRAMGAPAHEHFDLEPVGWPTERTFLDSSMEPDAFDADGELLVASLIAGISRKPSQPGVPEVKRPEPSDWEAHVGYGLYALYRSVINDFGGELHVRTQGHHLRLRAEQGDDHYVARVEKYADEPEFAGNLITALLPISS
ncbi:MAG: hypothetical protein V7607_2619 [Solirubrobacteraceae bacterium]